MGLTDRQLFHLAGWSVVALIAFFAWGEWRNRAMMATRGGKGYGIINTTGVRG